MFAKAVCLSIVAMACGISANLTLPTLLGVGGVALARWSWRQLDQTAAMLAAASPAGWPLVGR